ncbi:MAG: MotA/TolQ/ExbB proton channel family protein, partial [Bdellovibrionales bacterium]|nr:MotA/TolQ/ExbB proton channel family protein [Bdellovibrionales bacterium]
MTALGYFFVYVFGAIEESLPEDAIELPEAPPLPQDHSILDLVLGSGLVVQGVLLLLVLMSIVTWGIVFTKSMSLRKAKKQSHKFDSVFWSSKNLAQINETTKSLPASPVAKVYAAGHRELTAILSDETRQGDLRDIENIDRSLRKAKAMEITRLEGGTTFLATTASAAPFIGLFGTV